MVRHNCQPHEVEGFANRTDVYPGSPFTLYVSTKARWFTAQAFRMGWYGGDGAAWLWRSKQIPGQLQQHAAIDPQTRMVSTSWRPTLTVSTVGWLPGDYLIRLDDSNGCQQFVPLTLRSRSVQGRVVIVNAVTTWQAYNSWGNYSLYHGADGSAARRSYVASFDRPYNRDSGAGDFLTRELAAVEFISRLHAPIAWATSIDLATDAHALDGARAVVSLGHDEYYSSTMRKALIRARAAGTNLAFLGANAIYRHIRFAASRLGPARLEINYKSPGLDPIERTNPAEDTVSWRDNRPARPESQILGERYACIDRGGSPLVVADPTSWLLRGLGLHRNQRFFDLIGAEADSVGSVGRAPRPMDVLFHSRIPCALPYADTAYYTTTSGAGVFDAGTLRWQCALAGGVDPGACAGTRESKAGDRIIRAITSRLITAFAQGPAGRAHPAVDNLSRLPR